MLRAHLGPASHLIALSIAAIALFGAFLAPAVDAAPRTKAVPGELIVRFKPGVTPNTRSDARDTVKARLEQRLPVDGMQLVSLPAGTAPADAAARLKRQAGGGHSGGAAPRRPRSRRCCSTPQASGGGRLRRAELAPVRVGGG